MLNEDLQMKAEAMTRSKGCKKAKDADDEAVAGFHFIAFVPIDGKVWKLDGLERQPQNLGESLFIRLTAIGRVLIQYFSGAITEEDWVLQVKPEIEDRMAQYSEGQIEFAILSLVKEPLSRLVPALAENVKSLVTLTTRLDLLNSDWREFISNTSNSEGVKTEQLITGPDAIYELTLEMIKNSKVSQPVAEAVRLDRVAHVIALWQELVIAQAGLRAAIMEELQSSRSDHERAASRRHDYGLAVQTLIEILGRKNVLKNMVG